MGTVLETWFDLRAPTWTGRPVRETYEEAIKICEWADDLGFQGVTIGQHSCTEDNYSASPVISASVIGGRTKRLNLRMIILSPFYNPLKLAEDLAVMNLHTGGRALPVISAGMRKAEFDMYGIRLEDRANWVIETVDVLRKAWSGEPFEYRGRDIPVVTPVPDPKPRLLMGASWKKMILKSAEIADGLSPAEAAHYDMFREERRRLGKSVPDPLPKQGIDFMYISENPDKAWEDVFPYWTHTVNIYNRWAAERGFRVNVRFPPAKSVEDLKSNPMFRIFTPEECLEYAQSLGDKGELKFQALAGGMPPEMAWSSLKLFEQKVAPHLDIVSDPNVMH